MVFVSIVNRPIDAPLYSFSSEYIEADHYRFLSEVSSLRSTTGYVPSPYSPNSEHEYASTW